MNYEWWIFRPLSKIRLFDAKWWVFRPLSKIRHLASKILFSNTEFSARHFQREIHTDKVNNFNLQSINKQIFADSSFIIYRSSFPYQTHFMSKREEYFFRITNLGKLIA